MLYIEYQQARFDAAVADLMSQDATSSALTNLFNESSFNCKKVCRFQFWFDRYCEYAFFNCMNHYNDYSQLLIVAEDFTNYLELSKRILPQQWSFLRTTRGIKARDGDNLQEYKERQIFMVLLNLQRLAKFWVLKHWGMVILMAYYGWGAKDTVGHVTSFLGITVAWMTRDVFFKELTVHCVDAFQTLMASRQTSLMVWDNFQQDEELQEQRGGLYGII
jgi:hypothetical protein